LKSFLLVQNFSRALTFESSAAFFKATQIKKDESDFKKFEAEKLKFEIYLIKNFINKIAA